MRRLNVLFTPAEATTPSLIGKLVFPVDVLRFSTSAAQAVASGARAVYAFESRAALEAFAASREEGSFITAGEQDGIPLSGLDLGNSPPSFTEERCEDKDVLMVTTNGTVTLKAVESGAIIL
ncbi:MAG: 2-phosphosulfolactate phosphatase, partial [Planctomycetota bacterium]